MDNNNNRRFHYIVLFNGFFMNIKSNKSFDIIKTSLSLCFNNNNIHRYGMIFYVSNELRDKNTIIKSILYDNRDKFDSDIMYPEDFNFEIKLNKDFLINMSVENDIKNNFSRVLLVSLGYSETDIDAWINERNQIRCLDCRKIIGCFSCSVQRTQTQPCGSCVQNTTQNSHSCITNKSLCDDCEKTNQLAQEEYETIKEIEKLQLQEKQEFEDAMYARSLSNNN